jgi:hypothetical protein
MALAMQVASLCYSNRNLTDGFVPRSVAARLLDFTETVPYALQGSVIQNDPGERWRDVVDAMVKVGVWEEVEGGYYIHDYLAYQPSKAEVMAQREAKSEAGKKGAKVRWGDHEESSSNGKSHGTSHSKPYGTTHGTSQSIRNATAMPPTQSQPNRSSERSKDLSGQNEFLPEVALKTKPEVVNGKPRRRDDLWDAVMDACGVETTSITSTARGAYQRAVKDLRAVEANPAQVRDRAAVYRLRYREASLTPQALAKHWPSLDPSHLPPAVGKNDAPLAAWASKENQ